MDKNQAETTIAWCEIPERTNSLEERIDNEKNDKIQTIKAQSIVRGKRAEMNPWSDFYDFGSFDSAGLLKEVTDPF